MSESEIAHQTQLKRLGLVQH